MHDPCQRSFILPTRIIWQAGDISGADCLFTNQTGQATLGTVPFCTLASHTDNPAILLDFGRELNGGVQIVVRDAEPAPVMVRVRFGESVSEAMGTPDNDHATHDFTLALPAWGAQEIGNTGFRFVRVDVLTTGARLELIAVRAVSLLRPIERVGSFSCDDPRLNAIWETAAHTVHLCMQDGLWDGIKRDRLVWAGDMYAETAAVAAVFGNHAIVRESLDHLRDTNPLPRWMNGISSFSLWWLITHHRWFLTYGDAAYLAEQRPFLLALLTQLAESVGVDGREALPGFRFTDWPSRSDDDATHAGLQALLLRGMDAGADLCAVLSENEVERECRRVAAILRTHVLDLLPHNKTASALLALSGLHTPESVNDVVLAQNPAHGVSVFGGVFVLEARTMAGDYAGCLDLLRTYWGGMLDLGATTFWEDFDTAWLTNAARIDEITPSGKVDVHATYGDYCYKGLRHSLCHGWGAYPAAWLSQNVLGVKAASPGFRTVVIAPQLGDLSEASGTVPTPFGAIHVSHTRSTTGGTEIETQVILPDGVTRVPNT